MEDNDVFQFPCEFLIKIIGYNTDSFKIEVLSILREVFPDLSQSAISTRIAKQKNYSAMTVTVMVDDRQQLDLIYRNLSASQQVLLVL